MALRFAAALSRHAVYARAQQAQALRRAEQRAGRALPGAGAPAPAASDEPLVRAFELLAPPAQHEVTQFLVHQLQFKQLLDRYASQGDDTLDRVHQTARYVGLDATMRPAGGQEAKAGLGKKAPGAGAAEGTKGAEGAAEGAEGTAEGAAEDAEEKRKR